jgi:hypothetical protein
MRGDCERCSGSGSGSIGREVIVHASRTKTNTILIPIAR